MKIDSFLKFEAVVPDLVSREKNGALQELAHVLAKAVNGLDENLIFKALAERERLGSTGIGDGIAIPHAKVNGPNQIFGALGRSKKGVDFESADGKPTHLLFLLIAPNNSVVSHLAALERVSKLLEKTEIRTMLMEVDDDKLYETIITADNKE